MTQILTDSKQHRNAQWKYLFHVFIWGLYVCVCVWGGGGSKFIDELTNRTEQLPSIYVCNFATVNMPMLLSFFIMHILFPA